MIKQFFQDTDGKYSTGRLLTVVLFVLAACMWIIPKMRGLPINAQDVQLIQWALAISIGGKAISKLGEKK